MDFDLFEHFETTTASSVALDVDKPLRKRQLNTTSNTITSLKREKHNDLEFPMTIIEKYSAIPDDYCEKVDPINKEIRDPAKVYPFKLDTFQQDAINFIENDESVLVAAHTSAGKTAVAEYAIAKSLKNGQRVIYTSPIKALSNQKYRDLQEEFGDVGLMTGDMTINPNAACLIMTTGNVVYDTVLYYSILMLIITFQIVLKRYCGVCCIVVQR